MLITNGKATKFCARKWKNRSEKRKKNEEQLRRKKEEVGLDQGGKDAQKGRKEKEGIYFVLYEHV